VGNSLGQLPLGIIGTGPVVGPPAFISVPKPFGTGVGVLGAGEGVLGAGDGVLGAGDGVFGAGDGLAVVVPPVVSAGPLVGEDPLSEAVTVYSTSLNVVISKL
jgi:hypothetical protein